MSLFTGQTQCLKNEGLVSEETVLLHWWGSEALIFGIKQIIIDKDQISTMKRKQNSHFKH